MNKVEGTVERKREKTRVFFSLSVILALGSLLLASYAYLQKENKRHALERYRFTEVFFQELLVQRSELLHAAIDRIAARQDLQRAMETGNRSSLWQNAKPLFDHLQEEFGISHFYLHTPANQVFLRLHKPAQFGERINRYLLDQAFSSQRMASGIELGTHGTLTLRTLSPWIVDGRLIGYIELGEELDRIIRKMPDLTGVELLATVRKDFLDRAAWEEGMRMLGRPAHWDQFEDRVILTGEMSEISKRMYKGLLQKKTEEMTMKVNGNTYLGKLMPIWNAINLREGDFLVIIDLTEEEKRLRRSMALMSAFCLLLGLGLLFPPRLMPR